MEQRYWYADGLDPEELAFQRLYGPVEPATREEAAEFFGGLGLDWWVAGGWAVEAFTGVPRPHDDLDVSFWRRHVPELVGYADGRYHVWSAGSQAISPLSPDKPEMPDSADQVWLRVPTSPRRAPCWERPGAPGWRTWCITCTRITPGWSRSTAAEQKQPG